MILAFKGDKTFWKKLYGLQKSENSDLAQAAQGACFVITNGDVDQFIPQGLTSIRKPKGKFDNNEYVCSAIQMFVGQRANS